MTHYKHSKTQIDRLIRLPEVIHDTGLGRTSIYNGVADGTFPKPVKIGARAIAWRARDIKQWIDDRCAGVA